MIIYEKNRPVSVAYSFSGRFVTDDEWIHPTRVIDTYEILLVTHGEVYLREGNAEHHLQTGDLYLLRPDVEHGGTRVSTGRTSFFWAHFTADSLEPLGLLPGLCTPDEPDRLASAFRCLLHVGNTPGYPSYATDAALMTLLSEISASQAMTSAGSSRLAHEIAEWIRINSEKKLTYQNIYMDGIKYQAGGNDNQLFFLNIIQTGIGAFQHLSLQIHQIVFIPAIFPGQIFIKLLQIYVRCCFCLAAAATGQREQ